MKREEMLQKLREYFMDGSFFNLSKFDNKVEWMLDSKTSIFEYDTREMLGNGFAYNVDTEKYEDECVDAFNFEFEVIEDNEDPLKIVVKVTKIDWV